MVCGDNHKTTKLVVEAAIVISEISNPTNNCFRAQCADTEVVLLTLPLPFCSFRFREYHASFLNRKYVWGSFRIITHCNITKEFYLLQELIFNRPAFFDGYNFGSTLIIAHDYAGSLL